MMTAVKLLEDCGVPPQLPPKLFKSSELLHGVVRRPKQLRASNEIEHEHEHKNEHENENEISNKNLPKAEKKKPPPLPPPKTFKLSPQSKQAFYPIPPPIKEKPEKLRQRRCNDSSLVMAKMVYIPLASPVDDLEQSSHEALNERQNWTKRLIETTSLRALPTETSKLCQAPCISVDNQLTSTRREKETTAGLPRRRFDDDYGTCLDDDDDDDGGDGGDHGQVQPPTEVEDAPEKFFPTLQQQSKRTEPDPISAKAASLRNKQLTDEANVLEEIRVNNLFLAELKSKLEELQRTNELRKFSNYVSEVDHIAALVVSLSLRIGRTTALLNDSGKGAATHKAQLVQKLEKMEHELDEARRLEANCEKRWASFGVHLSRFLGQGQVIERYLHFMKNRGDLLVKQRTIVERPRSLPSKSIKK